ncbi:MAG TPA: hypothetical protein VLX32_00870 [Candidatus Acidoferrum sp.]|nr:hypothetical protein [Candidatus Acidoferrum sp.]
MKQRTQVALLVGLIVIAAAVWIWSSRGPAAVSGSAAFAQQYPALAVENPALHWPKLEASRKAEYKSSGRNPFSEIAPPPPEVPKRVPKPGDPGYVPPTPPPPPPLQLPVKFFGYGMVPVGTQRLAFLTDGDDVYVVGEGETLLGRYRILKVGNASLEFEEVSTGRRGSATLEDQGPVG